MSVNDFFRLILKLFALYCVVVNIFTTLPGLIGFYNAGFDWVGILWVLFLAVLLLALFILLAFQSDKVIAKLKLGRGFDSDHILFEKMDARTIINVGSIIIGGMLILNNFSEVLMHLFIAFRMAVSQGVMDLLWGYDRGTNTFELAVNVLNLIVGYLLLTNYAFVSKWLAPREEEMK